MSRINKTINGVFTNIVGTNKEKASYDLFMNDKVPRGSTTLTGYEKVYNNLILKNRDRFEELSLLETIILQMRVKESVKKIKLTTLRGYIYARCSFYRADMNKDIRIIVGTTKQHGTDLNQLLKDKNFMTLADKKLSDSMDSIINENIRIYNK